MKNNIFDISFGFALALPLAVMAGVLPLAVDNEAGHAALAACAGTLLLAWPLLARLCIERRHAPRQREFRRGLIWSLLLLPLAASGAMFGMIKLPGGYAGGIYWLFMSMIGATTVFLGWLAAALAAAFSGARRTA
jgi:hypothetical protein